MSLRSGTLSLSFLSVWTGSSCVFPEVDSVRCFVVPRPCGDPFPTSSGVQFPLNTEITDLVLMDWISTMHLVSKSNAVMDQINPFRRRGSQAERTAMEVDALEREVRCSWPRVNEVNSRVDREARSS